MFEYWKSRIRRKKYTPFEFHHFLIAFAILGLLLNIKDETVHSVVLILLLLVCVVYGICLFSRFKEKATHVVNTKLPPTSTLSFDSSAFASKLLRIMEETPSAKAEFAGDHAVVNGKKYVYSAEGLRSLSEAQTRQLRDWVYRNMTNRNGRICEEGTEIIGGRAPASITGVSQNLDGSFSVTRDSYGVDKKVYTIEFPRTQRSPLSKW